MSVVNIVIIQGLIKYLNMQNKMDILGVTTTLLISPYQKHDKIIEVCKKLEKEHGVKFVYKDYRPYFREGQTKARELGLYRQKFCGCIFSIDEGGKISIN